MEIERKYLVIGHIWSNINKTDGEYIIQGYLTTDADKTVRVRVKGNEGYLTIKGKTVNISREEYEFPIPVDMAAEVIQKFTVNIVEKIRYKIPYKGKTWEVDEFLGENEGLILAEIELNYEDEPIELPEWIEREVSEESRYFNALLSKYPFSSWSE